MEEQEEVLVTCSYGLPVPSGSSQTRTQIYQLHFVTECWKAAVHVIWCPWSAGHSVHGPRNKTGPVFQMEDNLLVNEGMAFSDLSFSRQAL